MTTTIPAATSEDQDCQFTLDYLMERLAELPDDFDKVAAQFNLTEDQQENLMTLTELSNRITVLNSILEEEKLHRITIEALLLPTLKGTKWGTKQ